MNKKNVTIAIQYALYEDSLNDWRVYWSNIYLSIIETLVFQKNLKYTFHNMHRKSIPLTLASFKAMANNHELSTMLNGIVKNHRFECFIRNIFRSLAGEGLFSLLISDISKIYEFPYPSKMSYYICGQDSHTVDVPLGKFKYKIPTSNGWIRDKSKIKNILKHCDAAIELRAMFPKDKLSEERILLLGEIEGLHGDKMVKKKYWIEEKNALSNDRYYHFGIGVSELALNESSIDNMENNALDRYEVNLDNYKVMVFIFPKLSNQIKDIDHATADIINIFNTGFAQTVPAIFSESQCYKNQKEVVSIITAGLHGSIFELLDTLRGIICSNNHGEKTSLDLNISLSDEVNGEIRKNDYFYTFASLEAMPSLINLGTNYGSVKSGVNADSEQVSVKIESNPTGHFLNTLKRSALMKV